MQQTTLKQNRKNYGYSTKMKVDLFNKAENIEEKGEIDHYLKRNDACRMFWDVKYSFYIQSSAQFKLFFLAYLSTKC